MTDVNADVFSWPSKTIGDKDIDVNTEAALIKLQQAVYDMSWDGSLVRDSPSVDGIAVNVGVITETDMLCGAVIVHAKCSDASVRRIALGVYIEPASVLSGDAVFNCQIDNLAASIIASIAAQEELIVAHGT